LVAGASLIGLEPELSPPSVAIHDSRVIPAWRYFRMALFPN